ncbi:MAG: preprotein translocase subunit YajC [Pirellulaceae bacterium]
MLRSAVPHSGREHFMPTALASTACMLLAQNGNATQSGWSSLFGPLFPFLMIAVLFYFLMIRPERRKKAELMAMLQSLKNNDRVVTIGGIYGTIVNAQQDLDEVTIKVDESTNTKLRMQRSAIARVITSDGASAMKTES